MASVAIELKCRLDSPAAARREMTKLEPEIGHGLVARVRVVVTEIVSNWVWNAAGGHLIVDVSALPATVRGDVAELDHRREARPPDASPFPQGYSLLMLRRLADRWGALDEQRGTWFEIDRPAGF